MRIRNICRSGRVMRKVMPTWTHRNTDKADNEGVILFARRSSTCSVSAFVCAPVLSHVAVFLSVFCGRVRFVFPHHTLASSVLFAVAGQTGRRQTKETESKQSRRCERAGNFIIQMQKHIWIWMQEFMTDTKTDRLTGRPTGWMTYWPLFVTWLSIICFPILLSRVMNTNKMNLLLHS